MNGRDDVKGEPSMRAEQSPQPPPGQPTVPDTETQPGQQVNAMRPVMGKVRRFDAQEASPAALPSRRAMVAVVENPSSRSAKRTRPPHDWTSVAPTTSSTA